jgi:hypothetical protein
MFFPAVPQGVRRWGTDHWVPLVYWTLRDLPEPSIGRVVGAGPGDGRWTPAPCRSWRAAGHRGYYAAFCEKTVNPTVDGIAVAASAAISFPRQAAVQDETSEGV